MLLEEAYYILNNIWYYGNLLMILPFLVAGINRFLKRGSHDLKKKLWTDHITRLLLMFTQVYYMFDIYIKYQIDGIDRFCDKTFLIHHVGTLFLLPPLFLNRYIPWWVSPIGFMHGFLIAFPQIQALNYIYVVFVFIFQYGLYQTPFKKLRGYGFTRFFINFIWVFALMLLAGGCTNHLDLSAP